MNKKEYPKASIIMSTYNCGFQFASTIKNISKQDKSTIEFLSINNNSTYNMTEILESIGKTFNFKESIRNQYSFIQ